MILLRVGLPILVGLIAAVLNFLILRSGTAPIVLTVVRQDVPADTELTEDMLEPLPVRAERAIFKSAVRYPERGVSLLGRRVVRQLSAGEVVLYTDVHNVDEENIGLELKPGESTLTFSVKGNRVARELRAGNSVGVLVMVPAPPRELGRGAMRLPAPPSSTQRMLGPFRLLSLGATGGRSSSGGDGRPVTVAIQRKPDGQLEPNAAALAEALNSSGSSYNRNEGNILAVEYYQAANPSAN
jgi:hypothetical protein